ncbi:PREDICTED: uncharacterized protein LOC107185435 [Dufourea novaeangliae]|uniref:Uncharacterized protein F58A4.6 n=1 Tax=Dufourea novaeangliae TaxID=178035 RepID=A0A154P5Q7_DUFNO|nr:PREDICTED: uncharacterized protein LOC107185435 [Dufourea novaeangliae]KZC07207.1 Uncharacterized protein F58A4.6 [Dufourea novaeangliae]
MDDSIKLIIHKGTTIFDSFIITSSSVIRYNQKVKERKITDQIDPNVNRYNGHRIEKINKICFNKNAYFVSAYVVTLMNSRTYRTAALNTLLQYLAHRVPDKIHSKIILMKLCTPKKQFLDYNWNTRITQMILERIDVDHTMSWLSTLGGAFSALGEEFQYCAEIAGKISVKQFDLALRLGDPLLVARCKLYAALSLIQQGQLKVPKKLVRNIYTFSITKHDVRLQNMCQGIWAKLKYCYKKRKEWHKRF